MRQRKVLATWAFCFLVILLANFSLSSAAIRSIFFIDIARVEARQKGWENFWAAGFGASFPLTRNFLIFLNYSRWRFDISPKDTRLLAGQLTLSPLTSGVYFLLFPRSTVSPIFSCGLGYLFSQYRPAEKGLVTIPEIIKLSKKVAGNFNWEVGAGISVRLSRRLSLWLQAERYQSNLKVETTVVDLNLGTIKTTQSLKFAPILYHLGIQLTF